MWISQKIYQLTSIMSNGSSRRRRFKKRTIPDWKSVAFLQDPKESLEVIPHLNEKLPDKQFNKQFLKIVVRSYPLPVEEGSEGDSEGTSIDLEAPSANEDEDDCYTPGEYTYEDEVTDQDDESPGEESYDEMEDVDECN
ncbi:hypothetical protein O181_074805 [Austropuccinia psidii MF-1]|uniref:Uncharacterized protein n=1 Tax=Austropuccinia psidii MF-1 TaxID=1389203 RepID=A0A9Q3IDD0_9BASI|nr:hypothetical protein [Austropuccinia psidii MF-1]